MWPRRLPGWCGIVAAMLGCAPDPASPDVATDATRADHVEDVHDPEDGDAALDDGPPALDVHGDIVADLARDVASDASLDTSTEASLDARVEDAPDARDTAPDRVDPPDAPDAPDVARDIAADLPLAPTDVPDAMDATRNVPRDDTPPLDAPPLDAPLRDAPPDASLPDVTPFDASLPDATPRDVTPLDTPPFDVTPLDAAADVAPPDVAFLCGDAPIAADARRDDAGQPCGQNGQACCASGSECDVGLGCVSTYGICAPFGEQGGPCFSDRRCGPGLRCEGPGSGRCVCAGASDACGTAAGWACRELVSVVASYQYVCCRMPGAACCSDRDCCGRIAGTAACRDGVCTRTGFVCNLPPSSCRTTPCCAPFRCEFGSQLCTDGN